MLAEPIRIVSEAIDPVGTWIVGGAVRDQLAERDVFDVDLATRDEPSACARAIAAKVDGVAFPLSEEFGTWRVSVRSGNWQVDVSPLLGEAIEDDLAKRDFTINAIARPLAGGDLIDPFSGARDLEDGLLRPVGPRAFADDPLRVVRLARFCVELDLKCSDDCLQLAAASAPQLVEVSGERILAELLAILATERASDGIRLLDAAGGLAVVMPELSQLKGVEQSVYHHLDCYEHTLAVLDSAIALQASPARLGRAAGAASVLLAEEFADGIDRWGALRLGAVLHDIAKSRTRTIFPDGRVGFPDHDSIGASMAVEMLDRLRTSGRLRARVASMVRWHLAAGFLTHRTPMTARDVHGYLRDCGDCAVDVTVLSAADRLATKGRHSAEAIERHLELVEVLLEAAVEREMTGLPEPLLRGDELALSLGIEHGPVLGEVLAEIEAARYAGEVSTAEEAADHASRWLADHD